MSTPNDGGPAFPSSNSPDTGYYAEGATLRDYFAAKALASMLANPNKEGSNCGHNGVALFARFAYEYADAMLAARSA